MTKKNTIRRKKVKNPEKKERNQDPMKKKAVLMMKTAPK
jgi:hypothetical protein